MKKILSLVMTVFVTVLFSCLFYVNQAQAKNVSTWADSKFDFSALKSVSAYQVDVASDYENKIDNTTVRDISAYNEMYIVPRGMRSISNEEILPKYGINIVTTIEKWDSVREKKDSYTSYEKKKATRIVKDKNGKKTKETYYHKVPVRHPATYTNRFTVKVRYDGYTPKGHLVYTYTELRNREETSDCLKTYKEIANNFKEKFARKAKRY